MFANSRINLPQLNNQLKIIGIKISGISDYYDCYSLVKSKNCKAPLYITVNNVHTVITAIKNDYYKLIINNSWLSLPDGKPLSIVAKLKGEKNIKRIFGPTFFENTLDWGQTDKIKHYLFGSSTETLNKMIAVIEKKYPSAIISGCFSPPFREFTSEENELFLKQMNESEADIFWIGLGAPKQEIWMYENYKKLDHGVMVVIGAGFDYLAGNTKHAPEWMKNASLEWLYRLIQEPGRLWKRYLVTNTLFIILSILELLGLRKFD